MLNSGSLISIYATRYGAFERRKREGEYYIVIITCMSNANKIYFLKRGWRFAEFLKGSDIIRFTRRRKREGEYYIVIITCMSNANKIYFLKRGWGVAEFLKGSDIIRFTRRR